MGQKARLVGPGAAAGCPQHAARRGRIRLAGAARTACTYPGRVSGLGGRAWWDQALLRWRREVGAHVHRGCRGLGGHAWWDQVRAVMFLATTTLAPRGRRARTPRVSGPGRPCLVGPGESCDVSSNNRRGRDQSRRDTRRSEAGGPLSCVISDRSRLCPQFFLSRVRGGCTITAPARSSHSDHVKK